MSDLQALIDQTADGSQLVIPAGDFSNDGETLRLVDRHGLTIVATGTILRRTASCLGPEDRQILIQGCSNISIANLTVKGPKPDRSGYDTNHESEHAFCIDASQNITIQGCVLQRQWGDHFYLSSGSQNVTLLANHGYQCGRHGISINSADGVTIVGNVFDRSHRWSISMERNIPSDRIANVSIGWNQLYAPTIGFINGTDQPDPGTLFIGNNLETWDTPPPGVE